MDADDYRLPWVPLGAWLEERYIRCGKSCQCREGQPHGTYWRLCWREDGCRRQRYLKAEDIAAYREAVQQRQQWAVQRRQWLEDAAAARRHARRLLR